MNANSGIDISDSTGKCFVATDGAGETLQRRAA
jgi:hypothetical protein